MKANHFKYLGLLPLVASCGQGGETANQSQPLNLPKLPGAGKPRNVVFILADDHRYDFMGFTGRVPFLETPNMDRMAREGVYLRNTFVTTALSSPSRASILTGMYSHRHTVVDNAAPVPPDLIFFPQYMQKAGYRTAFFGKWHMGEETDEIRPGFDHWESFRGQGVYYNPTLNINGKQVEYGDSAYITDLLTEHAVEWMKQQKKEQPFFIYLSHKAVHDNFSPARRHAGCYANEKLPLPENFNSPHYGIKPLPSIDPKTGKAAAGTDYYGEEMRPDWVKAQRESWHGVDYAYHGREPWEANAIRYCETLRAVDESIGAVLQYLEEAGLAESTLVIYMGDNGFAWGEHGLIDKRQFYEESVRVPMLAYCPELSRGGKVIEQMVQNIDVAPTILEMAGLQKPAQMDGMSFAPLLEGKQTAWRDRIFYEYYWEYDFPQTPTMHGVRTDHYKLIRYHGVWDTNEFFDLKNDPYETRNLIAAPEHQETIKQLTGELYDWLESTDGMSIPLKRTDRPHGDHRNRGRY
ncbi:MAG: sulfatase [Tannerella sp.]|jgi:arylsulfatase A-like enzyme|nr:sulfatase [Tannerella sp.]